MCKLHQLPEDVRLEARDSEGGVSAGLALHLTAGKLEVNRIVFHKKRSEKIKLKRHNKNDIQTCYCKKIHFLKKNIMPFKM